MGDPVTLGPWIISGVALVQVWVIAVWRRLRPAKLALYETGNIELGYSQWGPTLALLGTLRTRGQSFFVRQMSVRVVRERDHMTRAFEWRAFRPLTLLPSPSADLTKYDLASSFLLTPEGHFNYNIFFVDHAFVAENKTKVETIATEWLKHTGPSGPPKSPEELEAAYNVFTRAGGGVDAFTTLDRAFYWTAGKYRLDIEVTGESGRKRRLRSFTFNISEADERNLRLDVIAIQRVICGLPAHFNFAYPEYLPAAE